jgi:hypothetical protein
MVYACNGFLQYYGISNCNTLEFQLATFGIFILQQIDLAKGIQCLHFTFGKRRQGVTLVVHIVMVFGHIQIDNSF